MFPRHQLGFYFGVKMGIQRQRRRDENISKLRELMEDTDISVWQYSDVHLRIIGYSSVDYWPSTGKIWVTNSKCSGFNGTPQETVEIALFDMDGANDLHAAIDAEYRAIVM